VTGDHLTGRVRECQFDDPARDEAAIRRETVRQVLVEAVKLHFSPTSTKTHIATVARVFDESKVDYETEELDRSLADLITEGGIGTDRMGRVLPSGSTRSPIEIAKAFREVKTMAEALEDVDHPAGLAVSFSSSEQMLKHAIPTAAQELRLVRRTAKGERSAINELVRQNVRLASTLTRPYYRSEGAMDREDYLQEAALGLIRAAEKFDPSKGFRFSTYATWWVRQAARRANSDRGRSIRIPVHIMDQLNPLLVFRSKYKELAEIDPSNAEVADEFEIERDKADELLGVPHAIESLDDPECLGRHAYEEAPDFDDLEGAWLKPIASAVREQIRDNLSEPARTIIVRRYGLAGAAPETLDEVGKSLNITRERVRQIQEQSLKSLRMLLSNDTEPWLEWVSEHPRGPS
jgi:RNA polymerase sigma factor (sigma-70 family)